MKKKSINKQTLEKRPKTKGKYKLRPKKSQIGGVRSKFQRLAEKEWHFRRGGGEKGISVEIKVL